MWGSKISMAPNRGHLLVRKRSMQNSITSFSWFYVSVDLYVSFDALHVNSLIFVDELPRGLDPMTPGCSSSKHSVISYR